MNKRIQKKQHNQYFKKLAKNTGVKVVSKRQIKHHQLIDTKKSYQDFNEWFDHDFKNQINRGGIQ